MRKLIFIHVSDIHFGQEKDETVVPNTDIRERLIDDARDFLQINKLHATGAIVTGDIAYSGTKPEYDQAAVWLDRLAAESGFNRTEVVVVPGNHDSDRKRVGDGGQHLVNQIIAKGDGQLDIYLRCEVDRQTLYSKLEAYRLFAGSYGCLLDEGGGGAGEKPFYFDKEEHHGVRFVGLNSAIACGVGDDEKGKLLLGVRQRTISPAKSDMHTVVLVHHPIEWCSDAADAMNFIRERCRVLICGHEHQANASVEPLDDGRDFLTIRAGAATPPKRKLPEDPEVPFTYNIVEFEYNPKGLAVMIHPRDWDDKRKRFKASERPMIGDRAFTRTVLAGSSVKPSQLGDFCMADDSSTHENAFLAKSTKGGANTMAMPTPDTTARLARIRLDFFRILPLPERLRILTELRALPPTITEGRLTVTLESRALDKLVAAGHIDALEGAVAESLAKYQSSGESK